MTPEGFADALNHAVIPRRSHDPDHSHGLSSTEQISVIRAIRIGSTIRTLDEYSAWLDEDLESLLHHCGWGCGLGCLQAESYTAAYWLASRGPQDQLATIPSTSRTMISPLLTNWLKSRRPQIYVRAVDRDIDGSAGNLFAPDQPDNAVMHCQMDPENKWTSVFAFANLGDKPGYRQRLLLDLLVPHLHATLCRVLTEHLSTRDPSTGSLAKLTARELQILRYIRLGRTNAEIADTVHKSVFTVNNQVVKLLAKLGAKNRTQAVFVAKEMGLLRP